MASAAPSHGGNRVWAAALARCRDADLLDFSASISPFGPPTGVIEAIQDALPRLPHYPDPQYRALRQALGTALGLAPDWLLPGNGSAELLTLVARTLGDCSEVVLVTPAFGDYFRALRGAAVPIQTLDWDVWGPFPWEKLRDLGDRRRGLILNNPHNPTGALLPQREILPLLERFAWVVADEAFMDFLPPPKQESLLPELPNFPNLIVLRSLTKFHALAGLRLGFAGAAPQVLTQWQNWRDPWPVGVLAEAAALAALQDQDFAQKIWRWLPPARAELERGLNALPGLTPFPGAVNFLLVASAVPVPPLQEALLKNNRILIRDCLSFPELGDRFFRAAVRTPAENQRLLAALGERL
ncbi:MAG: threonine-phosphate decarboxylase CobD [Cyanobacteriota bacterium]|nr:threonine-phosphate decarboxylase CobD [Cyanobacteriota bacterium]